MRFDTKLIYTHNSQISNFQNPSLPELRKPHPGELGDPQDEFRWDVELTYGAFTFGYQMRYIGPMVTNLYEDFNEVRVPATRSPVPARRSIRIGPTSGSSRRSPIMTSASTIK